MTKALAKQEVVALEKPSNDVEALMIEAVRSGNLDVMERVMAIRRELKAEAAKEAFFAAMAAFQKECPIIKRTKAVWNKEHSRITYHYAPLDQIEKQAGPYISKNGLSYTFKSRIERTDDQDDVFVQECHIQHEAGHKEVSEFRLPIRGDYMNDLQKFGNTNTYAKRYSFCNAFGILTEDDDQDGRIAPKDARETKREVRQPQMTPTAQKAANGSKERVQLEPAGEGEEAIDASTVTGLTKAMEKAALGQADFVKRFPNLSGLEQVRFKDARVVMSWIADPQKN